MVDEGLDVPGRRGRVIAEDRGVLRRGTARPVARSNSQVPMPALSVASRSRASLSALAVAARFSIVTSRVTVA